MIKSFGGGVDCASARRSTMPPAATANPTHVQSPAIPQATLLMSASDLRLDERAQRYDARGVARTPHDLSVPGGSLHDPLENKPDPRGTPVAKARACSPSRSAPRSLVST